MKDDPTIEAIRAARDRISKMVGHDPRKLVEYYRRLQARHSERLLPKPATGPEPNTESAA